MKKLSVVLPTYNRKDTLKVTLAKLAEQTYPASQYEVLVVDDGSTDGTGDVVQPLIGSVPYQLRYLHHANKGPGFTLNRGILEAQGEIVVLITDDIWVTPTFLEEHMTDHARNPEPNIAILGKVLQSPDLPKTPFLMFWDPLRTYELEEKRELSWLYFWACNISMKRQFFLDHGGFLEYHGAANEDVELGYRLYQRGMRILYNKAALGYHYHVEILQNLCRRWYMRGLHWSVLEENIQDPQIYANYGILSLKSSPPAIAKNIIRMLLFNRLTVPLISFLLHRLNPFMVSIMPRFWLRVCWQVISYYFRKGATAAKHNPALREHHVKHIVGKEVELRATLEGKK